MRKLFRNQRKRHLGAAVEGSLMPNEPDTLWKGADFFWGPSAWSYEVFAALWCLGFG